MAIVAAFVGIASALLTIFLTPNLQHYFWTRQREAKRKLAIIDELNKAITQLFRHGYMDYDKAVAEHRPLQVGREFHEQGFLEMMTLHGPIHALFSPLTVKAVDDMLDQLIALGTVVPDRPWAQLVDPAAQARVKALQALYQEVGIPSPSLGSFLRANLKARLSLKKP